MDADPLSSDLGGVLRGGSTFGQDEKELDDSPSQWEGNISAPPSFFLEPQTRKDSFPVLEQDVSPTSNSIPSLETLKSAGSKTAGNEASPISGNDATGNEASPISESDATGNEASPISGNGATGNVTECFAPPRSSERGSLQYGKQESSTESIRCSTEEQLGSASGPFEQRPVPNAAEWECGSKPVSQTSMHRQNAKYRVAEDADEATTNSRFLNSATLASEDKNTEQQGSTAVNYKDLGDDWPKDSESQKFFWNASASQELNNEQQCVMADNFKDLSDEGSKEPWSYDRRLEQNDATASQSNRSPLELSEAIVKLCEDAKATAYADDDYKEAPVERVFRRNIDTQQTEEQPDEASDSQHSPYSRSVYSSNVSTTTTPQAAMANQHSPPLSTIASESGYDLSGCAVTSSGTYSHSVSDSASSHSQSYRRQYSSSVTSASPQSSPSSSPQSSVLSSSPPSSVSSPNLAASPSQHGGSWLNPPFSYSSRNSSASSDHYSENNLKPKTPIPRQFHPPRYENQTPNSQTNQSDETYQVDNQFLIPSFFHPDATTHSQRYVTNDKPLPQDADVSRIQTGQRLPDSNGPSVAMVSRVVTPIHHAIPSTPMAASTNISASNITPRPLSVLARTSPTVQPNRGMQHTPLHSDQNNSVYSQSNIHSILPSNGYDVQARRCGSLELSSPGQCNATVSTYGPTWDPIGQRYSIQATREASIYHDVSAPMYIHSSATLHQDNNVKQGVTQYQLPGSLAGISFSSLNNGMPPPPVAGASTGDWRSLQRYNGTTGSNSATQVPQLFPKGKPSAPLDGQYPPQSYRQMMTSRTIGDVFNPVVHYTTKRANSIIPALASREMTLSGYPQLAASPATQFRTIERTYTPTASQRVFYDGVGNKMSNAMTRTIGNSNANPSPQRIQSVQKTQPHVRSVATPGRNRKPSMEKQDVNRLLVLSPSDKAQRNNAKEAQHRKTMPTPPAVYTTLPAATAQKFPTTVTSIRPPIKEVCIQNLGTPDWLPSARGYHAAAGDANLAYLTNSSGLRGYAESVRHLPTSSRVSRVSEFVVNGVTESDNRFTLASDSRSAEILSELSTPGRRTTRVSYQHKYQAKVTIPSRKKVGCPFCSCSKI